MLRSQFLCYVLKTLFFIKIALKLSYFCKKNAKFSSAGGSAPRPLCLRRLGASLPDPQPPAAGVFAPSPHWPSAAGGSAPRPKNFWLRPKDSAQKLRPKDPKTQKLAPPHCEFLATRMVPFLVKTFFLVFT